MEFNRSFDDARGAYALGLWCADGYWWSSSVGLSNTEPELIERFGEFLTGLLGRNRVRLRVYLVRGTRPNDRLLGLTDRVSVVSASKMKRTAYHVYVNSRPLLRAFRVQRERVERIREGLIGPYVAGRLDGDGTLGVTPRIVYRDRAEATMDAALLASQGIKTSVYRYDSANEFCIYIRAASLNAFVDLISLYSWKTRNRMATAQIL